MCSCEDHDVEECTDSDEYCRLYNSLKTAPVYSNVLYTVAGLYAIVPPYSSPNEDIKSKRIRITYGCLVIGAGIVSTAHHWYSPQSSTKCTRGGKTRDSDVLTKSDVVFAWAALLVGGYAVGRRLQSNADRKMYIRLIAIILIFIISIITYFSSQRMTKRAKGTKGDKKRHLISRYNFYHTSWHVLSSVVAMLVAVEISVPPQIPKSTSHFSETNYTIISAVIIFVALLLVLFDKSALEPVEEEDGIVKITL